MFSVCRFFIQVSCLSYLQYIFIFVFPFLTFFQFINSFAPLDRLSLFFYKYDFFMIKFDGVHCASYIFKCSFRLIRSRVTYAAGSRIRSFFFKSQISHVAHCPLSIAENIAMRFKSRCF